MYCPKCRTQYIENVNECFDCKVPLVDELPVETPLEKIKWVALTPLAGDIYAEMVEEVLQKMAIPNFTKSDWATSAFNISSANLVGAKVTIFVPEENRNEAAKLIEELLGEK
ncbi:MAG: hypothetical protein KAS35_07255 [Candidatus Marinimicrobia bacterium]|nr:hypothetical protein [Candidatus Neomarinimicrobiota bacterium]